MPVLAEKDGLALKGKKGCCFVLHGNRADEHLAKVKAIEPVYWHYGWCAEPAEKQPDTDTMEFMPMTWGGAKTPEAFRARVEGFRKQIQAGKAQRILCFNEPDKEDQSNMSVEKVLSYWKDLESLDVPLVSPSCANPYSCKEPDPCCQNVAGTWMKSFMKVVERDGLRVDYMGVHWYGGPCFGGFKKRMREIYEAYGSKYPLLITEFAVADWKAARKTPEDNCHTQEAVLEFMKKALPWLEAQDWIAGYAWFPFRAECPQGTCSALFHLDGKITALGRYYASVSNENPQGNQNEKVWCPKK